MPARPQFNRIAPRALNLSGYPAAASGHQNAGIAYDIRTGKALWHQPNAGASAAELGLVIAHDEDHLSVVHHRVDGSNDQAFAVKADGTLLFGPTDLGLTVIRRGLSLGNGTTIYWRSTGSSDVRLIDAAGTVKQVTDFHPTTIFASCVWDGFLYVLSARTSPITWRRVDFAGGVTGTGSVAGPQISVFNSPQPAGNPPVGTFYHANGLSHATFQHDGSQAYLALQAGIAFTSSSLSDALTTTSHGLTIGDVLRVSTSGTLPAPLATGTDYFVVATPSANMFQVSASSGGPVLDITSAGTGAHRWWPANLSDGSSLCAFPGLAAAHSYTDLLWTIPAQTGFTFIRLAQNSTHVFALQADPVNHLLRLSAHDKTDGNEAWSDQWSESLMTTLTSNDWWRLIADEDHVVVCDSRIRAYAAAAGAELWDMARSELLGIGMQYSLSASGTQATRTVQTFPILAGDALIFANVGVQVLEAGTGEWRWTAGLQSFRQVESTSEVSSINQSGAHSTLTGEPVACAGDGDPLLGIGGRRELLAGQREPDYHQWSSSPNVTAGNDGYIAVGGSSLNTATANLRLDTAVDATHSYLWSLLPLETAGNFRQGATVDWARVKLKLMTTPAQAITVVPGIRSSIAPVAPPDVATFLGYTWLEGPAVVVPVAPAVCWFDIAEMLTTLIATLTSGQAIGQILFRLRCSLATGGPVDFYAFHATNDNDRGERWPRLEGKFHRAI